MKPYIYAIAAAGVFLAYGIIGSADRAEAERQQDQYCEMIELWEQTNGDAGWPPYKGEC